ncbi:MAG: hypothetical protein OHK0022_18750 [Roseiflexaceae bacterium]
MIRPLITLTIASMLLVGCQSTRSAEAPTNVASAPTTKVELTTDPIPTDTPKTSEVQSLSDVRKAVVRIVAEGAFIEPSIGEREVKIGGGSGFIIDPTGIAVTNNHVVTGAGRIKVFLDGEEDARDAEILGASECSDLAVIKIDGENFPYLNWSDQDIAVNTAVHVTGYPDGDSEFTSVSGTISRAKANGESDWSAVKTVFEHTAPTRPGNSGSPVVNDQGRVVGIDYAGIQEEQRHFAISWTEALKIVNGLRKGENISSIGINGVAVSGEVEGKNISGIWVRSVRAGSPADKARIEAGDLITNIAGIPMAKESTMTEYCDVIRQNNNKTIDIEVLRYAKQQIMKGQINGRELEIVATTNTEPSTSKDPDDNIISYEDDFRSDTGRWETDDNEYFSSEISDGEYRIIIKSPNSYHTATPNYIKQTTNTMGIWADIKTEGNSRAGVAVRYSQNNNDESSFYTCWIDGQQHYGCFVAVDSKWTTLSEQVESKIIRVDEFNRVGLISEDGRISLIINDVEIVSFRDDRIEAGLPALYLENFDTVAGASFKNVRIKLLPDEPQ